MSYNINIVRLRAVANALDDWKDKVIFVGGATVRATDDVDVVVELLSTGAFYKMQERLLELGFKHDIEAKIIRRSTIRAC
jgi:hypothetical protein